MGQEDQSSNSDLKKVFSQSVCKVAGEKTDNQPIYSCLGLPYPDKLTFAGLLITYLNKHNLGNKTSLQSSQAQGFRRNEHETDLAGFDLQDLLDLPDTLDLSLATNLLQFGLTALLLLLEESDQVGATLDTQERQDWLGARR